MGSTEQTKTGNLIVEGVLRLGQFTTANAPSGTEGALYFDTTENATKLYSDSAWNDLSGGWDGIIPNYTTTQRDALSPSSGMMIYNTDNARVEYYLPDDWAAIQAPFALGHLCTSAIDCASEICVDGYCCDTACTGNCNRCNVAGSLGICIDVPSDCTGNCDVCSAGNCGASVSLCTGNCDVCFEISATEFNCTADATICTGNCDTCSGSGTAYSCAADAATYCTGNCDVCSGSGTAYNCAASNALCSNNASSCYCSGSGTVFNCQSCSTCTDCSSYSCYDVPEGTSGYGCTGTHYRCDGAGACTAPYTNVCVNSSWVGWVSPCSAVCTANGNDICLIYSGNTCYSQYGTCAGSMYNCDFYGNNLYCYCVCGDYIYD